MQFFRHRSPRARVLHLEALESRFLLSVSTTSTSDLAGLNEVLAEYGFMGSDQTVVVIDSGIAFDHEAFSNGSGGSRVVGGWDFAENDANPYDDGLMGSHGTHVAGILAGDSSKVTGVASDADIVALRVFDDQGNCELSWVEEALRWVHEHRNSFENPITTVNLSLGTSSNLNSVPSWAILEDELAQLAADGIFVTVAAGNSFVAYQTPGLCYPAISPYVFAVASLDANGSLSYYSQRADGILAAPGRSIVSAVPDYLGDQDGVADDYAACSGTSMAAPYVAGASALLRQAYEFVGVANVSTEALYSTLIATADKVYDVVTGTYFYRLNIDRAIDSIMPSDDFGSTAAAAKSLGSVTSTASTTGTIATLSDQDWFSFQATASGKVTITAKTSGDMAAFWESASLPSDAVISGNTITFSVVAGKAYSFGIASSAGLGHYSLSLQLDANVAGCLVVQVGQQVRITGTAGSDIFSLIAGSTYQLTVNGQTYQFQRSAVSSFVFDGGAGSDTITVSPASGTITAVLKPGKLDLTASGCKVSTGAIENITVHAGVGSSRATLYDSTGDDTLVAAPSYTQLSGSGFSNRVEGFSSVTAIASKGNDVATLYDSAGNDTLSISSSETSLSGSGFANRIRYFDEVHAIGDGGGYDKAVLYGLNANGSLTASGNKAAVLLGSATSKTKIDLEWFECVQAIGAASKSAALEIAALDFVLEVAGKRV